MLAWAVKVKECSFGKGRSKSRVSLIKLLDKNPKRVKFALHLAEVSYKAKTRRTRKGTRSGRVLYLETNDEADIIGRYFLPNGGLREEFPDASDIRWRVNQLWLDPAIHASLGKKVLIGKPVGAFRGPSRLGGKCNKYIERHAHAIADRLMRPLR